MSLDPKGCLYICATPIGHLKDITLRALETFKKVAFIYCEDTRVSRTLLAAYAIEKPLISLHKHNEASGAEDIIKKLRLGEDVALISDAGTPNISDPGSFVVRKIVEAGYSVVPIPGASSVTALLSVSGVLANHFCFCGFFPKKSKDFIALVEGKEQLPLIFFETPKRIIKTLQYLLEFPHIEQVVVGKELSKRHESVWYKLEDALLAIKADATKVKGEWVILLVLKTKKEASPLKALKALGFSFEHVMHMKRLGLIASSKNEIYEVLNT